MHDAAKRAYRNRSMFEASSRKRKGAPLPRPNFYTVANLVTGRHDLPEDVWLFICRWLSIPDVVQLSAVCKKLHCAISNAQRTWERSAFFGRSFVDLEKLGSPLRLAWKEIYRNPIVFAEDKLNPWRVLNMTHELLDGVFVPTTKARRVTEFCRSHMFSNTRNSWLLLGTELSKTFDCAFAKAVTVMNGPFGQNVFFANMFLGMAKLLVETCFGCTVERIYIRTHDAFFNERALVTFGFVYNTPITEGTGNFQVVQKHRVEFHVAQHGIVHLEKFIRKLQRQIECDVPWVDNWYMCKLSSFYRLMIELSCSGVLPPKKTVYENLLALTYAQPH